jgi:HB1/ASXL restriction endonuclease-like protein with HTH domain
MATSKIHRNGKPKKTRKKSTETEDKGKKLSALDAAAQVLAETGQPMSCKEMIEAMAQKRYWSSPSGKTPASTLYSGILKEITTKGKESRFKKTDRGRFAGV